jgi:hypothetical protein
VTGDDEQYLRIVQGENNYIAEQYLNSLDMARAGRPQRVHVRSDNRQNAAMASLQNELDDTQGRAVVSWASARSARAAAALNVPPPATP